MRLGVGRDYDGGVVAWLKKWCGCGVDGQGGPSSWCYKV